jgi:hypothetical protein
MNIINFDVIQKLEEALNQKPCGTPTPPCDCFLALASCLETILGSQNQIANTTVYIGTLIVVIIITISNCRVIESTLFEDIIVVGGAS